MELNLELWLLYFTWTVFALTTSAGFLNLGAKLAEKTCLLRKSLLLHVSCSRARHLVGGQFVTILMSNYAQLYRDRTNKIMVLRCMHKTQLHPVPYLSSGPYISVSQTLLCIITLSVKHVVCEGTTVLAASCSFLPSVRMQQLGSHWKDFDETLCWGFVIKLFQEQLTF